MSNGAAVDFGSLPAVAPAELTVVFDGWCAMCTRSARLLGRLDRRASLDIVAAQAEGVADRTGLSPTQTDVAAWAVGVAPDGTRVVVGGARAIALAVAVGRGARWPLRAFALGPLGWLADRVYRFVAEHRRWFPGETPWCEANPGRCAAGTASCAVARP